MPPDLIAGQCLQIDIPSWVTAGWDVVKMVGTWIASAFLWLLEAADDDRTALSVVFALDAGFATIDYFMKSILHDLRNSICWRLEKYKDPKWEQNTKSGKMYSDVVASEKMDELVQRVEGIRDGLKNTFEKSAKRWKLSMGGSAAAALVCMAIPYCGRITILLALPVPLFALSCHGKKNKIKSELNEIDAQYDELIRSKMESAKTDDPDMLSRIGKLEDAVSALIGSGIKKNAKHRTRKTRSRKT